MDAQVPERLSAFNKGGRPKRGDLSPAAHLSKTLFAILLFGAFAIAASVAILCLPRATSIRRIYLASRFVLP
jgi:hypothetical protein